MNGVAREFWSEVLDVKVPVEDERGGGGRKLSGRKKTRKLLVRRGGDRRVG
jgi:hypothetical protein